MRPAKAMRKLMDNLWGPYVSLKALASKVADPRIPQQLFQFHHHSHALADLCISKPIDVHSGHLLGLDVCIWKPIEAKCDQYHGLLLRWLTLPQQMDTNCSVS